MNCKCGKESEVGCHGISEGSVMSFYFCMSCWSSRKSMDNLLGFEEKENPEITRTYRKRGHFVVQNHRLDRVLDDNKNNGELINENK